jgi:hypothetical protein
MATAATAAILNVFTDSALRKAEVLQVAIEQFVIADTDGDGMLEKQ